MKTAPYHDGYIFWGNSDIYSYAFAMFKDNCVFGCVDIKGQSFTKYKYKINIDFFTV